MDVEGVLTRLEEDVDAAFEFFKQIETATNGDGNPGEQFQQCDEMMKAYSDGRNYTLDEAGRLVAELGEHIANMGQEYQDRYERVRLFFDQA